MFYHEVILLSIPYLHLFHYKLETCY